MDEEQIEKLVEELMNNLADYDLYRIVQKLNEHLFKPGGYGDGKEESNQKG